MRSNTFRPTITSPHAQDSSSGTADVGALTAPEQAQAVFLTVETTSCYATFDGSTPDSSNGILLPTGVVHFFPIGVDIQFAASAETTSKVNALWVI